MSPHKDITQLSTIFPTVYISYPFHTHLFGNWNFKNIYLLIYLGSLGSCCSTRDLPSCGERGLGTLHCGVQASRGFSCGARFLGRGGFSNRGALAQLPHSMCCLPGSGIEHTAPALAGRFLITGPPRNSCHGNFVPQSPSAFAFFPLPPQSSPSANHLFVLFVYNAVCFVMFVHLSFRFQKKCDHTVLVFV